MILHFSHIGLTDGLTFMIPFGWSLRLGSGCRDGRRYRVVVLPLRAKLPAHSSRTADGSNYLAQTAVRMRSGLIVPAQRAIAVFATTIPVTLQASHCEAATAHGELLSRRGGRLGIDALHSALLRGNMPGGQNTRGLAGDGHRELEMRGE
jgi:hypothetical protein